MASYTEHLQLLKKDPVADGADTFNVQTMLNDNWEKIDAAVAEENRFDETIKDKKEEDLTAEEKSMREELSKKVVTLRDERNERLREIGGKNSLVRQIIDLALLTNGMLKGKNLTDFIQRSISLIEK